jgi:hypothetical protein
MHAQNVPVRTIEPGEEEDLVARPDPVQAIEHARLEDQPGVG